MFKLEEACAKLYTKHSFLFRIVNQTLREDDRSKLSSLGPFCYLLYTYVGNQPMKHVSRRYSRLQQMYSKESLPIILYRGDCTTDEKIKEYREVAGQKDKYVKWLSFVSTSLDENVATTFSHNILYEIELNQHLSSDQFAYLESISYFQDEREVLLQPGVRFRVKKVYQLKSDEHVDRTRIRVTILPSFIWIRT